MSRNSSDLGLAISIAAVVGVCWFIAQAFGVPFKVAVEVLPRVMVWGALLAAAIYVGYLEFCWPAFLGTVITVLSPILDHWAGGRIGETLRIDPAWYGEGTWQFVMAVALTGCGYGVRWWWNNRYSY